MTDLLHMDPEGKLTTAMERAVDSYIRARRQKIPGFVKSHFSIAGAARINRKAVGADLVKAPLNVAWAVPYTAVQAGGLLLNRVGLKKAGGMAKKFPPGFKTAVQQEIHYLIFTRLLELPCAEGGQQENAGGQPDALLAEILDQPEIRDMLQAHIAVIHTRSKQAGFRQALERRFSEYAVSRTAVSELAGNMISLAAGAGVLGKVTPGGLSFGAGLAAAIAQQSAISGFFLGPTLGGIYYGLFPATASLGLVVASTSGVMAGLAVVSAFSGMITDPIQARLGIHEKRLNRLVDSLEKLLKESGDPGLDLKAHYLVRLFDLIDLFKTAANTVI